MVFGGAPDELILRLLVSLYKVFLLKLDLRDFDQVIHGLVGPITAPNSVVLSILESFAPPRITG